MPVTVIYRPGKFKDKPLVNFTITWAGESWKAGYVKRALQSKHVTCAYRAGEARVYAMCAAGLEKKTMDRIARGIGRLAKKPCQVCYIKEGKAVIEVQKQQMELV